MTDYKRMAAKAGAGWWADRLRSELGIGDNGSDSTSSMLAMGFTRLLRGMDPPTEEQASRFEAILTEKIVRAFDLIAAGASNSSETGFEWHFDNAGWNDGGPVLTLRVDYYPERGLMDALKEAGISKDIAEAAALPCKTDMFLSMRSITVSAGYGAPMDEIYGPLWGSTYKETMDMGRARYGQKTDEMYKASGPSFTWDWHGPIQEPIPPRPRR